MKYMAGAKSDCQVGESIKYVSVTWSVFEPLLTSVYQLLNKIWLCSW